MKTVRSVFTEVTGTDVVEGAGVHLRRIFADELAASSDPFLLLDAFESTNPQDYIAGFPWHPHRGIETVTYMLDGQVEHGDSLGNKGVITAGSCQWMSAGSGIIHQEMPKPSALLRGVQLWVNLPASRKMRAPVYRDIGGEAIPIVDKEKNGCQVKVLAGHYGDRRGPMGDIDGDPTFLDVSITPGGTFTHITDAEDTVFAYILEGSGALAPDAPETQQARTGVLMSKGSSVAITASVEGLRVLLFVGTPIHEPIAWRGPIVMNTEEELDLAFRELKEGTFLR